MIGNAPCPCGSPLSYAQCCFPFHDGKSIPATAEALMRSRFVAFQRQDAGYLLATWNSSTRPVALSFTGDSTEWLRLEILACDRGGEHDDEGRVQFRAYFHEQGVPGVLEETSRFRKLAGRWYYLDGEVKVAKAAKIGANAICPCGSGKKFKRCCGR